MFKKKTIIIIIALIFLLVGIPAILLKHKKEVHQATIVTGLTEGQQKTFQQDLSGAFKQYSYIKKGNALLANGKIDDAINNYNIALSLAKSSGTKGNAYYHLANAYEKNKNYKKAIEYVRLDNEYTSEWAKPPVVERIKYLEYAVRGDHDKAIEHAQRAVEEEKKRTKVKGCIEEYAARLNDLIAAKDYILSLKKKQ